MVARITTLSMATTMTTLRVIEAGAAARVVVPQADEVGEEGLTIG
jgi:hypothetical protein